jgi:hypothetical protein
MDVGTILLMRHAERPAAKSDPHLAPAGKERALKLVQYIPTTFGKPAHLFASKPTENSDRPLETLQPLSENLGLTINADFADDDYAVLAKKLLSDGKFEGVLTVVCWHHQKIPHFAHALGAKHGEYPDPWDDNVYNLILRFDFNHGALKLSEIHEPF